VLLHQGRPLTYEVVVAPFLLPESLLHLLGVAPGLHEATLDLLQARLRLLLLLDDLEGRLPLPPRRELPRLSLFNGDGLLLLCGVARQHLLVGHRPRGRHLELLQVI
jgi:hypothetical protein